MMNRRNWLKSGTLAVAGATIPDFWRPAEAAEAGLPHLAGTPVKARLMSNENPYGPSQKAQKAIADAISSGWMYPRDSIMTFRKMIARENNISEDQVLLGAGSGELLMASGIHYTVKGGAGTNIVGGDPTYMQLLRTALALGAEFKKTSLTKDFTYDYDRMAASVSDKTSLVYLCNPNNPTGILEAPSKMSAFCEDMAKRKPIFIDEAYMDYAADPKANSMMSLVKKGHNVLIARTFSKIHGFAGLRIGYLVGQPDTLKEISNYCTGGGSISATSVKGAIASYLDEDFQEYSKAKCKESKEYLYKLLKDHGYSYLPSSTNFVLFPIKMNGKEFVEKMAQQGVALKSWEFANQQWCRISMGTLEEMKLFGEAFSTLA
ncbi:MAG: aminotransferase class I/II-fold pyridoxal phosphate-dependent enzyme [Siphonobacter sp.]